MKKTILLLALGTIILSCNKKTNENQNSEVSVEQKEQTSNNDQANNDLKKSFNIEDIPYSNADLGSFPFFTLPEGLTEQNKPLQKKIDVCFFPVNGVMTSFEGKLYKTNVTAKPGEEFSQRYFEKSIEDYLNSIGAVKVFDGEITKEEFDRYNKKDTNKGNEGDIGYTDEQIKFYVIRSKSKGNIYVQFSSNNAAGKLNILQEEVFQQTIKKVTADDIAKDLTEKGKSILYINFDVDKATISTDGKEVVNEIAQALKKNTALKIAIEGHTDNTGDAAHNKKLSNDRANAVLSTLTTQGIDKSRLSAKGFGAERPLVANDSEDNKSKNRRVELVKIN
ncbi:Peptidoglycan-associated lipoprotein [Flavobacterium bizetiae]|uniref:Peptidoglycan-associated lipoprotein n=1 Tax=Flavobacterium bizetiae TaxID=2704140 RepID=A0A6J4GEC7_9FLAO|nr:OmpA family protein [Flavobacterium bizetiae]CAA9196655.1 Peptidoglycan-associated lipoprotein [Flavobacterium bizetiae]CAD5340227.1 Peptidoglycan-associated lipoprotein [Flavobacterium bizetiae]CAD5348644.1 Peptidoglycan-associated lipoprotein [Flavobacterium bizetiae]